MCACCCRVRSGATTSLTPGMLVSGNFPRMGPPAVSCIKWKQNAAQLVLAIGREDASITIHDLRDEEHAIVLRDHVSSVTCMEWKDEHVFVSAGRDAVLNTWKVFKNARKQKKRRKGDDDEKGAKFTYQRIHTLPIYEQVEGMAILNSNESICC